jgi:hypothetical protein
VKKLLFIENTIKIKSINTAGQALHLPPAAVSAVSRGVLNPSFPHSLDRPCKHGRDLAPFVNQR